MKSNERIYLAVISFGPGKEHIVGAFEKQDDCDLARDLAVGRSFGCTGNQRMSIPLNPPAPKTDSVVM